MRVCTKTEGAGNLHIYIFCSRQPLNYGRRISEDKSIKDLHNPTQPQTYTIQIDKMKEDNDPDQNNNAN
jgi:hypothetical protein